jgi:Tol biopolymer transport system component/tRNA A-37 threonylcarbamoyl transferase component Bud32
MAVGPGSRVGVYEVTAQIGAGAMGVVLRARDTKLLRDVALKVLPDHFADNPDRLSRLQREAQLLASLNHPNIAHVYGLEQTGASACIVMELVEGETLADRLQNGPIPLDDAVGIAKQIADALAAAHGRGIVHRDLKPANIKLAPNGAVKVLDFGLAKPITKSSPGSGSSMLPTMVSGSGVGTIVGTVAYMSPEQARGKEVDARTDIWAFGCVFYEMLTGRPVFDGETATDVIAKVVTDRPDFDALPAGTPASIRALLTATLNKNVAQRLQHIGDASLFLDPQAFPAGAASPARASNSMTNRRVVTAAVLVAALAAAFVAVALYTRRNPGPAAPAMMLQIALPGYVTDATVSPDAQRIAYVAEPRGERRAIWIRALGSEAVQKVPGSEAPQGFAWSPDSRALAFIAEKKLKKLDVTAGSVQTIADLEPVRGGISWGRGVILLATSTGIFRMSDEGGAMTRVTELDATLKENAHVAPVFLPDGNHFLYVITAATRESNGIFVGALDGKTKTRLGPFGSRISGLAYAPPGYLILAGESLTAQRLDLSTLTLSGPAIPIGDAVDGVSVSDNGLLVYRKASTAARDKQLTWFDRAGRPLGQLGSKANYGNVELSPTGDRVAVDTLADNNRDVWVIDLARGVPSRITFDPRSDWTPVWSPDGSRIAFAAQTNTGPHMYQKSAAGVGTETLMFKSDATEIPVSWSHDGHYIVFSRFKPAGAAGVDTWLLNLSGEPAASPYLESPFDKAQARISPDGRWLAFTINDSGMYQIMVQSFPDPNRGRWQITAQGGIEPKWRRDGRELYYLALDGNLMAVPIKDTRPDQAFEAGTPITLFPTALPVSRTQSPRDRRYDVAPDGRFLIATPAVAGGPEPVTAVVNWASGLEKK